MISISRNVDAFIVASYFDSSMATIYVMTKRPSDMMRILIEKFGIAILPGIMTNTFAAYLFSILITGGTMLLVSLLIGWEPRGELLPAEREGWLRSSQLAIQQLESEPQTRSAFVSRLPAVLAVIAIAIGCTLSFLVFW